MASNYHAGGVHGEAATAAAESAAAPAPAASAAAAAAAPAAVASDAPPAAAQAMERIEPLIGLCVSPEPARRREGAAGFLRLASTPEGSACVAAAGGAAIHTILDLLERWAAFVCARARSDQARLSCCCCCCLWCAQLRRQPVPARRRSHAGARRVERGAAGRAGSLWHLAQAAQHRVHSSGA